jgi:hypothetical protein
VPKIVGDWPRMWRVIDHVISRPELHDQAVYITPCGTAGCIAGWTAMLEGYTPVFTANNADGRREANGMVYTPSGTEDPHLVAAGLLGIKQLGGSDCDSYDDQLFDMNNSLMDILTLLCEWADRDDELIPARITRVVDFMEIRGITELVERDAETGARVAVAGVPA